MMELRSHADEGHSQIPEGRFVRHKERLNE